MGRCSSINSVHEEHSLPQRNRNESFFGMKPRLDKEVTDEIGIKFLKNRKQLIHFPCLSSTERRLKCFKSLGRGLGHKMRINKELNNNNLKMNKEV